VPCLGVCEVGPVYHDHCLVECSSEDIEVGLYPFATSAAKVGSLDITQQILDVPDGSPFYLFLLDYRYYPYKRLEWRGSFGVDYQFFECNKCLVCTLLVALGQRSNAVEHKQGVGYTQDPDFDCFAQGCKCCPGGPFPSFEGDGPLFLDFFVHN